MTVVRWILAVVGGVISYWIVMLMSLGVMGMTAQNAQHTSEDRAAAMVGHSPPLLGLGLGLGSFAAVFVAIAIAPHSQRKIMGAAAVLAAAAWAIYGQLYAKHDMTNTAIEAGGDIVGAVVAYSLGQVMFRPRARS